jgi:hypothetical protein
MESVDAFYDNSDAFKAYFRALGVERTAAALGVRARDVHTIHPQVLYLPCFVDYLFLVRADSWYLSVMAFLWDRLKMRFPISVLQSFMTYVSVFYDALNGRLLQLFFKSHIRQR